MDRSKLEISTESLKLGDLVITQAMKTGDWEATYDYIVRRTNLTEDEAFELDLDDVTYVLLRINEGLDTVRIIAEIARNSFIDGS